MIHEKVESVYPIYKGYWVNKQKTLISPDASQLNQLSCLKLFCQIQLICTPISMDETENIESQYSVCK